MKNKRVRIAFILIGFVIFCVSSIKAQKVCGGNSMLTEKICAGDEISADETKLYQIINQYRQQNNLAPIPISKTLSALANRHLLDIVNNLKKTTHSWSNCPYDLKDSKTWNCVGDAPERLAVGYAGQGFENLYCNLTGNAEPSAALEAWKKSDIHNSLILNLSIWKDKNFDALGIAVNGKYASLWFGTQNGKINKAIENQGLGISYKDLIKNLNGVINIKQISTVDEQNEWKGISADKTVMFECLGTETDISKSQFELKINVNNIQKMPDDKKRLMRIFITNIFGESERNAEWLDENLAKLNADGAVYRTMIKNEKMVVISRDNLNNLILLAKPYNKAGVREVRRN